MTVETDVIAVLKDSGLTVYNGGSIPSVPTFPHVVFNKITHPVLVRSHQGNEMERPRVQIDVWAKSYQSLVTTSETVKGVIDLNRTDFMLATKEEELDLPEPEPGLFHRILDFFVYQ